MSWGLLLALAVALFVANFAYLIWYFRWEEGQTTGLRYFGRTASDRENLKRRIRLLSLPALPMAHLFAPLARRQKSLPSFTFEGVPGPAKVSRPDVFARAKQYEPKPEDVFVATQMRCGTTWMQQVVYQIVTRGNGEFRDDGFRHLYAISPWIDAINSVSMDAAPLVGAPPVRIIKTHLPIELCPYSASAKYIYVARHPVSCFASIIDFNRSMVGPFLPPSEVLAEWYCSDGMYWLPWPRHVEGWWQWSQSRPNVLFVHFEEMTRNFDAVLDRVAAFLNVPLTPEERAAVSEHCSFNFMKAHEESFEMAPPTMFSVAGGQFLASGKERRHDDVSQETKDRILKYTAAALAGKTYPVGQFYPDVVAPSR